MTKDKIIEIERELAKAKREFRRSSARTADGVPFEEGREYFYLCGSEIESFIFTSEHKIDFGLVTDDKLDLMEEPQAIYSDPSVLIQRQLNERAQAWEKAQKKADDLKKELDEYTKKIFTPERLNSWNKVRNLEEDLEFAERHTE
jgi:hypothetical protein